MTEDPIHVSWVDHSLHTSRQSYSAEWDFQHWLLKWEKRQSRLFSIGTWNYVIWKWVGEAFRQSWSSKGSQHDSGSRAELSLRTSCRHIILSMTVQNIQPRCITNDCRLHTLPSLPGACFTRAEQWGSFMQTKTNIKHGDGAFINHFRPWCLCPLNDQQLFSHATL